MLPRGRLGELRCGASCYFALKLAAELAGASVPSPLLRALRPSAPRRALFVLAWRLRAVRGLEAPKRRPEIEAPRLYLLEMGRPVDKGRFLARVAVEAGRSLGRPASLRQTSSRRATPAPAEVAALPACPRHRDGLIRRTFEGGCAVHDPETDRTVVLNASATAVFELCDGERTAGGIAGELARTFTVERAELPALLEVTLRDFVDHGLLGLQSS